MRSPRTPCAGRLCDLTMYPGTICRDLLHGVIAGAISGLVFCGIEEALVDARVLYYARAKTLPDLETASETSSPRQCA